mgnify:CR=1 FL=1
MADLHVYERVARFHAEGGSELVVLLPAGEEREADEAECECGRAEETECQRREDDEAERILLRHVEGEPIAEPRLIRFQTGMRRKAWNHNVVSLGLASGFIEPLESTSIHLIQNGIARLFSLFPEKEISPLERDEYNRGMREIYCDIRDFIILHYKATKRDDTPFWRHCAAMAVPDSLTHKMELFRETGRVFRKNEELFAENSWVQVMMGQGITPQSYHPVAAKLRPQELEHLLTTLRDQVSRTVSALPDHEAYVARYCGAQDVAAA